MTLAAMRAARVLGYRLATLEASGEGCSIYQRLGFQPVAHADIYLGPI
jgi:hypothetical protein